MLLMEAQGVSMQKAEFDYPAFYQLPESTPLQLPDGSYVSSQEVVPAGSNIALYPNTDSQFAQSAPMAQQGAASAQAAAPSASAQPAPPAAPPAQGSPAYAAYMAAYQRVHGALMGQQAAPAPAAAAASSGPVAGQKRKDRSD